MRMGSRYGHRWTSQFGDRTDGIAAAEWRQTVGNVTKAQIDAGFEFDRSRAEAWPPASTEFAAWCRGIPPANHVLQDLDSESVKRDPFLLLVWQHLDCWALGKATQQQARHLILDAYDRARFHVLGGGRLPTLPAASLEAPKPKKRTPARKETVERETDRIREVLGE